uniref:Sugar phosphate transporter domain-containing protein n=1 Tax=Lotharella globosa TaxID=91324 RepID=A0A7S4DW12_9EUKA
MAATKVVAAAPVYSELDITLSVCAFMAASAGMSIANKMAVNALPLPLMLVGIQCLFTAVLVPIVAWKTVNMGSWSDKLRWFPVSILFVGMLGTSMVALQHCSLGTAVVVRLLSPVLSVAVESTFNRAKFVITPWTIVALATIIGGVALYAVFQSGLSGETIGIVFMVLNMLIGTSERLMQRFLMVENPVNMSDTGFMIYNNSVCFLAMPMLMGIFHEWGSVQAITNVTPVGWTFILWSCLCGASISYVGFRAQRRISATSFLIVANLNKLLVVAFGIIVLGEVYKPLAAIGAFVSLLGGAIYTWDRKMNAKKVQQEQQAPAKKLTEEEEPLIDEEEEV